jgi:hypothetical protein
VTYIYVVTEQFPDGSISTFHYDNFEEAERHATVTRELGRPTSITTAPLFDVVPRWIEDPFTGLS